jgi:hypothetical protein
MCGVQTAVIGQVGGSNSLGNTESSCPILLRFLEIRISTVARASLPLRSRRKKEMDLVGLEPTTF